jgi:hypothetical protein
LGPLRQEAALNRKGLKPLLDKGAKLTNELTRPESAIATSERPEEIGHKQILRFYPSTGLSAAAGEFGPHACCSPAISYVFRDVAKYDR